MTLLEMMEQLDRIVGRTLDREFLEPRPGDVRYSLASIDAAARELGYSPLVGFPEGLERTVEWYRSGGT